eukprot:COSAG05_NODE_452_length_9699_cov_33.848125_10_plen_104_part_00
MIGESSALLAGLTADDATHLAVGQSGLTVECAEVVVRAATMARQQRHYYWAYSGAASYSSARPHARLAPRTRHARGLVARAPCMIRLLPAVRQITLEENIGVY